MMKKLILIGLTGLMLSGCAGYHGTLEKTPTGMKGDSNKPMEMSRTEDKDGNVTMTFSSKKSPSMLENIVTIISLGLIKR
jgi:hypothetical protein